MPRQDAARPRLALAHFMLGNTYSYTLDDWTNTYEAVRGLGLDGLVLNLGPEEWQCRQAKTAYHVFGELNQRHLESVRLCLSLDMNVLPCATETDLSDLVSKVSPLMRSPTNIRWGGGQLLSTFSGFGASFGGHGWQGLLEKLSAEEPVTFIPAFFASPEQYGQADYAHGAFAWNAAWPAGDHPINLDGDGPFLSRTGAGRKSYMAGISPCFFTHYGKTGTWAWDKNWIYRSDDLLLPRRFQQLLELPTEQQPDILQVISWNDYGESHYIGPVIRDQPGSDAWTNAINHEAFAGMVRFWVDRWKRGRRGLDLVKGDAEWGKLWIWYRTHPAKALATKDEVGRPRNADWAVDLINVSVVPPEGSTQLSLIIENGGAKHLIDCKSSRIHLSTAPFVAGPVRYTLLLDGKPCAESDCKDISGTIGRYNFNFWTDERTFRILEGPGGPSIIDRT